MAGSICGDVRLVFPVGTPTFTERNRLIARLNEQIRPFTSVTMQLPGAPMYYRVAVHRRGEVVFFTNVMWEEVEACVWQKVTEQCDYEETWVI